jgi:hypothetical protein
MLQKLNPANQRKTRSSKDDKTQSKKVYKQVRSLAVEYSARIRYSRRLDTSRVREVHIGSYSRVKKSMVFAGRRGVQCENVCNQRKF